MLIQQIRESAPEKGVNSPLRKAEATGLISGTPARGPLPYTMHKNALMQKRNNRTLSRLIRRADLSSATGIHATARHAARSNVDLVKPHVFVAIFGNVDADHGSLEPTISGSTRSRNARKC